MSSRPSAAEIRDSRCAIAFDPQTGAVAGIRNVVAGDELLEEGAGGPFRIHADFAGEWLLDTDPEAAAQAHVSAREMTVARMGAWGTRPSRLSRRIVSRGGGFECELCVALQKGTGESVWTLKVTNVGDRTRNVIVDFPRFEGVHAGPPGARNLATRHREAGDIVEAWSHPGGVYGNGGQWSMQWHSVYDPDTRSAFGVIVEDPELQNKRLVLAKPTVAVRTFPPRTLAPGESMTLPPVRVLIGQTDWRQTARAYAKWYAKTMRPIRPPQWVRRMDSWDGRHFKKRASGAKADYGGQFLIDSFRELPGAHLRVPFDNTEYAFWSRGSMLTGKHTDGDNMVREDLGGPDAMRDGIAGLHRLGMHATLYIEGYIVSMESDLAKEGKAQRWSVMHRDGSITGGYTSQGFYHMCPGCVEWQDHLVSVVQRVMRQTGADGVRLDSLGFYFLPCYNPAHRHASPFGYNAWMQQLLAKVRAAAVAVNPSALLTTEAPVDFYGRWFHGALTQTYPSDLPAMRLAVGPYRPFVYAPGGPFWGSVSGLAGGRTCWEADVEQLEANWVCAEAPILDALVWGDVADNDPACTDALVSTRRYVGKRADVVVAVRRKQVDGIWRFAPSAAPYEVRFPVRGQPGPVALCDVETLTWRAVQPRVVDGDYVVAAPSSWMAAVVPAPSERVVTFDPLPDARPGDTVSLHTGTLAGPGGAAEIEVIAPGLRLGPRGAASVRCHTGDTVRVRVPDDALPGWYSVRVRGRGVLGVRRLLRVVR